MSAILLLLLLVASFVSVADDFPDLMQYGAPMIYAPDWTYLGRLSKNPYDPESTSNRFGRYGSPYSPDSINNRFGVYGSPYSIQSPNNPYVVSPPPRW